MPREIASYREQYEVASRLIEKKYPNCTGMLTTEQTADYLGCNVKTVLKLINRRTNPLPAKDVGVGRVIWRVPMAALVRWSVGGRT